MANFSISYIYQIKDKMSPTLDKISKAIKKQNVDLEKNQTAWQKLQRSVTKYTNKLTKTTEAQRKFNQTIKDNAAGVVGIAATAMTLAAPIKKAMDFESAMINVAKASNIDLGSAEYKKMSKDIREMTREMSLSHVEIANIVEEGARLGVPTANLKNFTQTVAEAAVALDLAPKEAAANLAKMSNQMGIPIEDISQLTNVITVLDNTTAAKGENIINVMGRIAGTAKQFNMSSGLSAGLSAFAAQIAPSDELAASGINMMIARAQKIPEIKALLNKDPEKAINLLLKNFNKLTDAQKSEGFGEEALRFMNLASRSTDLLHKTLSKAGDLTKITDAAKKEFETKMQGSEEQYKIFNNALSDIAITFGTALLPALNKFMNIFAGIMHFISDFIDSSPIIAKLVGTIVTAFLGVAAAVKIATLAAAAFNLVISSNPLGIVIRLAIAGIIALIAYWEDFTDMVQDLWVWMGGDKFKTEAEAQVNAKISAKDLAVSNESETKVVLEVRSGENKVTPVENKQIKGRSRVSYNDAALEGY